MSNETNVPGIKCVHAIISPTCMQNRSAAGAIIEAQSRVEEFFLRYHKPDATYHVVLTVEWPGGSSATTAQCQNVPEEEEKG